MPSDAGLVMMTSPDGTGAADNAVADRTSQFAAASADRDENGRDDAVVPAVPAGSEDAVDPWFTPSPKVAGGLAGSSPEARTAEWRADAGDGAVADDYATTEWFLPSGRAGLLPESMTESADSDDGPVIAGRRAEPAATGSPPWSSDAPSTSEGEPPPWENGPWPGPGEQLPPRRQRPPLPPTTVRAADESFLADLFRLRSTRLILAGGAAALVLIVILVVILTGAAGGSGGCGTYPAAVRQAYTRAVRDLGGAPADVQATDLGLAAREANESAASAGQIGVRSALFAMASDLEQAHADVVAHRAVSADLRQRLTADGTALPASCSS